MGTLSFMRLLNLVVLARLLGPDAFGVMSAAFVVIGLSYVISDLGVGYTLVQRRDAGSEMLGTGMTVSILTGVVLFGVVWLAAEPIAEFFARPELVTILQVLAIVFPLRSISIPAEAMIQRDLDFGTLAKIDITSYSLGYFIVSVSLAYAGFGVWALVTGFLGEAIVRTALLVLVLPQSLFPSVDRKAARTFLNLGTGVLLTNLANYVATQGDKAIVGRLLGTTPLGEYERAYQLMVMPANLLGQVVGRVLFPVMAHVRHDKAKLQLNYRRSLTLTAVLTLPISVFIVMLSDELVRVLLGPGWERAIPAFRALGAILLFRASYKMSHEIVRACGAVYQNAWRQAIYALLVILGAGLGARDGITGVSYGVAIAITVNFLLVTQLGVRLTGLGWSNFSAAHFPALTMAGLTAVACYIGLLACDWLGCRSLFTVLLSGALCLASVMLLLGKFPGLIGPDREWLSSLLRQHALSPLNRAFGQRS